MKKNRVAKRLQKIARIDTRSAAITEGFPTWHPAKKCLAKKAELALAQWDCASTYHSLWAAPKAQREEV
jgi:hypothetical protein